MELLYQLTDKNIELLTLAQGEKICYCFPLDLDREGNFRDNSYTVVTDQRILLLEEGSCTKAYRLSELEKVVSEPQISSGILYVVTNGKEEILGRYSAKHLTRYSYIMRGCLLLQRGEKERVISSEYETACLICGRALPGTKECPKCTGKKEGLVSVFLTLIKPQWKLLCVILLLMLTATVVTLANPAIQQHLMDDVLIGNKGNVQTAVLCLGLMFVMSLGIVFANAGKSYLCSKLGSRISAGLREELYVKIQLLSLSFINERSPGELMNRIIYDTGRVREFMGETFCNMFTIIILFAADALLMLILDWKLALLAFIFAPVAVFLSTSLRKYIRKIFHMQGEKADKVNSGLQDAISGMSVVKSYGQEEREAEFFDRNTEEYAKVQRNNEVFFAVVYPFIGFVLEAGVYLVIYFGGVSVLNGRMTPGRLFQFIVYTALLYQYIGWLTNMPRMLMNMVTSMERIGDVLKQEPQIFDHEKAKYHKIQGNVEFDHATFGYKSYEPVIEQINFKVKPGEMIGIVGASGAGKSTLINLVMHLYEVDDGEIRVDGENIMDIRLSDYHSQIGVVLQETFLFSGTILSNIQFARPEASYEEIIRAAKMANAHDFICRLPDGYQTYVGEKGHNLSGGERQRVAIARAILNDPRILILDEATASLDTESEYLIQKALQRLTSGRTTFAIAHRLSTLKDADRLIVIDGHRIAESGTHGELIEMKGIYYSLVKAQLMMQENDN